MQPAAQAYGRALAVWGQWLRQYRHTRAPRALQTAIACREIAAEKLGIWHAELKSIRSVRQAERVARSVRSELFLDKIQHEIQGDESVLRKAGLALPVGMSPWPGDLAEDALEAARAEGRAS
jgi:hypothetical protein